MNVTITGNLGAGKTSVCNELKKMGYDVISGGDIYRTYAQEHGITIVELNEMAKTDRSVDIQIDERTKKLGTEVDHTIFDSRMAWHFVPDALNIFLAVDAKTAAKRVYADKLRKGEEIYANSDCEYTENRQKADEWAASMGNIENATTNEYVLDLQGLNILNLDDYGPLTWIAEIAYNRHAKSELALLAAELICDMYKVDTSNADIIIGYRAGGVYMNALNAFLEGTITVDETERLFRMANLGEQYFLKSEKAFEQIVFTTSHKCEKIKLQTSDMLARAKMQKFLDNRYEEIRHGYRPELKGLTVDDVTANKFNYNKDTNSYELEGRGNV